MLANQTVTSPASVGRPGMLGLIAGAVALHALFAVAAALADDAVEEIIITSNRRAQNVQDVVGGISVLDGGALESTGAASFDDYVFRIPGADYVDDGAGKKIALRGVANQVSLPNGSGTSTSPIAIYLGDTPIQGNGNLPDLDVYDVERIEVLKGPQGTLYGEGAQGGAFRLLLNHADPDALGAKGDFGIGHTVNGSGLNHFQKVALNVPILGSWAVRLVGTRREDQGYVDFPKRGTDGEDDATNLMGRVHVDGRVWDPLSVSMMLFHQRQRLDQFPMVQLSEPDLTNHNAEPQFADTDFTLGALTLNYDLSFATLTSSTSGFRNDREALIRVPTLSGILFSTTGSDYEGNAPVFEREWMETDNGQDGFAQELRMVSNGDSWLDWVGGFYWRKRENDFHWLISNSAVDDFPELTGRGLLEALGTESYEQYAFFGETTVDLPWKLQLGTGLRWFHEDVGAEGVYWTRGPLFPIAVAAGHPDGMFPEASFGVSTTALTPKISLSWFADDARMLYALVAKGVRSGGTNTDAVAFDQVAVFEPDVLWTYEMGVKTQWLDGLLTANLAAFYNDWKDLQVLTTVPARVGALEMTTLAVVNAARAFTRGVELELGALPLRDLPLGFNLFVGDGEIVEGDEAGDLPDGTRMPQLAHVSYSAFAAYEVTRWPVVGFTPRLQFDVQATGERSANPPYAGVETDLDGFHTYNLDLAFVREHLEIGFDVNNLTDARRQIGANNPESTTITIGRPRTWTAKVGFRW
jgi:iron complex outermembrane recepter protein